MKILIAIFHKDRIEYLNNLLHSINRFIPNNSKKIKFIIFDDSQLKSTKKLLKKIDKKFYIIRKKNKSKVTLGNLYLNMNKSLEFAKKGNFDYLITLQDDTQIVRTINKNDFIEIKRILNDKKVLCINPSFLRKINCDVFKNLYLKKNFFYLSKSHAYSDNAIFSVKKLKNLKFNFLLGEHNLDTEYRKKYFQAYLIRPWFNHLPWTVSSRKSKLDNFYLLKIFKNLLIKINGYGLSAGINSIYLSLTEDKFLKRNIKIIPTDELYLRCKTKLKLPWSYDPFWSFKKYKSLSNLIKLKWIFGGSMDYEDLLKKMKIENVVDKKIFFCRKFIS